MKLADFHYNLPEDLIAKYPVAERTASRLLVAEQINNKDTKHQIKLKHQQFKDILELFKPGDLLVLNNTKVMPARFYGQKSTGAKVEFLLERILDDNLALCYIKANRAPKSNTLINLNHKDLSQSYSITVIEKQDCLYLIKLNDDQVWHEVLDAIGSLPLPPYINRKLIESDAKRYQTVFAEHLGAVAAPTAGLHFDQQLLDSLKDNGVKIKYVTLHVGAGTFTPVRVDNIKDHKMHSECYSIELDVIKEIIAIKNNQKNKVVACGTTSLRCLESVFRDLDNGEALEDTLQADVLSGETDIFIYPGFEFRVVDSLITNFHLPESTLMMLVSAFAGYAEIQYIYQQAIDNRYRFFSYGDAMWLNKKL